MTVTRTKLTRTGLCINGQCEATKPKSSSGKPMPVCLVWEWCKCNCHKQITDMYELAGLSREEPEQNPDFRPNKSDFYMPSPYAGMPDTGLSSPDGATTLPGDERAVVIPPNDAHGLVSGRHGTVTPLFADTPSGRRARGKLEYEVLDVCADWSRDVFDWEACTPKNISEEIGKRLEAECPSTGAIVEVFKRWDKLDFASYEKKPIQFASFLMDPSLATLNMLKSRVRSEKRRTRSDMKRGVRPPQPR